MRQCRYRKKQKQTEEYYNYKILIPYWERLQLDLNQKLFIRKTAIVMVATSMRKP